MYICFVQIYPQFLSSIYFFISSQIPFPLNFIGSFFFLNTLSTLSATCIYLDGWPSTGTRIATQGCNPKNNWLFIPLPPTIAYNFSARCVTSWSYVPHTQKFWLAWSFESVVLPVIFSVSSQVKGSSHVQQILCHCKCPLLLYHTVFCDFSSLTIPTLCRRGGYDDNVPFRAHRKSF